MKNLFVVFLLGYATVCCAQYQPGYLPEFFFGRMPSARAEAMGKAYASIDGGIGSVYFNPAGGATAKTIEIYTSFTPQGYYSTKGYYTNYGISYNAHKYVQIALSRFQFNLGNTVVINANTTPYVETNTVTISSEPIKHLLVGLNANYFVWQPGLDKTSSTVYFDLGVIKKFLITHTKKPQTINVGASIRNVNYAATSASFNSIPQTYRLPVITRYGVNYQTSFGRPFFLDSASLFRLLTQVEYQVLLNSPYRSIIKFGGEITWANIFSLRAGWYSEKTFDFGFPDDNKNTLQSLTYGVGVHIPLHSIISFPIEMKFDFTSVPQVSYSKNSTWGNFKTYSLQFTYSKGK